MTTYAGTREFAQKCLEEGYMLNHSMWYFTATSWACVGGCCNDDGLDIEEVMNVLDRFGEGKYQVVRVMEKL